MRAAVEPKGETVRVGAREGGYGVMIGEGLLTDLPTLLASHVNAHRFAIITDDNVAPLHTEALAEGCREAGLDVTLLTFPAGEASKTRKSWSILTDEMLEAGFGRDACVVAVGGGVTTDLAGFVAATYMRGIPVVQVPTSYLAMIDASVGGKTGVDVRAGKNLVGAFHPPELVIADTSVLATLPEEGRVQGLVEAFKHGAILDDAYLGFLGNNVDELLAAKPSVAQEAVVRSVQLKAAVVAEDEFEAGYRQVLNFGHTVGHALEAASDFALGHGSAVALGMVVEARVGERMGATAEGTVEGLEAALSHFLPPVPNALEVERITGFLAADKKARKGRARYVLLREIGKVAPGTGWTHDVPEAIVIEALEALLARR